MIKGRSISIIFVMFAVFIISTLSAQATLELRGMGTSADGTYRLIYDTDLNITWYDYSRSLQTWGIQTDWASNLSVDFGGNVYDDWRLPIVFNPISPGPWDNNCANSEMGHLYCIELGNSPASFPINTGLFQHLGTGFYWTGSEAWGGSGAWRFTSGTHYATSKSNEYSAFAVRAGDVAVVPEPISSILFVTGGTLLVGRRFIRMNDNF